MRISESPKDRRFREEAREWLAANVPATRRPADGGDAQRDFDVAWRRRQFEGRARIRDYPRGPRSRVRFYLSVRARCRYKNQKPFCNKS